jgi:ketosteroid isomerase-like protein
MRNLIITLLFSTLGFMGFAQTKFTENTLREITANFVNNPEKLVKEFVSPDFIMIGHLGQVANYEQVKNIILGVKHTRYEDSEVQIQQVGNIAIVRGVKLHEGVSLQSQNSLKINERYTYTFQLVKGKWLWTSAHHTPIISTNIAEQEAIIKKLIEDERAAFHEGRANDILQMWKDDPKSFHVGAAHNFDNETIKKLVPTLKSSGKKVSISNYRIKINGNIAIADFDQVNTTANGGRETEHDVVMLERVSGEWKFIGSSIHSTLTKDDNPEEIVKQWIAEYNKDGKSFFEKNCSDDFIASNTGINGGKFFGKEVIVNRARKENETNDVEATNMRSFKSANLAVVTSYLIWHHRQPDGSDKPDKTVSTWILQKKNGKWGYTGHHISPLKE